MSTLLLTGNDMNELLDMPSVIAVVEQAFKQLAEGEALMPPKAYLALDKGDFRAMPARVPGGAGIKWVSVFPQNPSLGLPTVAATLIFNDPVTGYPLAIMDATEMTAFRTGATAAIASKYLARRNSRTLGLVGTGRQARAQLQAHAELFEFDLIRVFDPSSTAVEEFIQAFPEHYVQQTSLKEAVASDIVCTATPAREPMVKTGWILPGTHINAIGADAKGKEELEPELLKKSMVVVDDLRQSVAAGEINVPVQKGLYRPEEVHASLAEVISGQKTGRTTAEAITIFDSTGVAIEDIATAKLVYERAKKAGKYLSLELIQPQVSLKRPP